VDKDCKLDAILSRVSYFIKFQSEEEYAKKLVEEGHLFMQASKKFVQAGQQGNGGEQGDIREGIILDCMRRNTHLPIYCMYAVKPSDIRDNKEEKFIYLSERVISGFFPDLEGYITVIDPEKFLERFREKNSRPFDMGLVSYAERDLEFGKKLFSSGNHSLLHKDPSFSHQNEFRIIVDKKVHCDQPWEEASSKWERENVEIRKYKPYNFYLGSLEKFARTYKAQELLALEDGNYLLRLR